MPPRARPPPHARPTSSRRSFAPSSPRFCSEPRSPRRRSRPWPSRRLNALGMKCPQPVLKVAALVPQMAPGDTLKVSGNCPTFEADVRKWAERMKKTILAVEKLPDGLLIHIQF
ncbi:MAG: sulfurtransferase TusA family protein [Myxococcales bacterium]